MSLGLLKSEPLAHGWDSSDLTGSVVSDAKRGNAEEEEEEEEEEVTLLSTGETKESVSAEEDSAISGIGEV